MGEVKMATQAEGRTLRWPSVTNETRLVAAVLGLIGVVLWQTERFAGLGDNLVAAAAVVFVAIILEWGRELIFRSGEDGRNFLRRYGFGPRDEQGE
jgi:hypothetical protein